MSLDFVYCPRCGAPLADGQAFGRTRRLCRYCGYIQFKDPKVAVAALVTAGTRVLLVRRAVMPRLGYWALPAGYMDQDELPEEAVMREIAEETGLAVQLAGLESVVALGGWQERRGILVIYRAETRAAGVEPSAGDDASEARWFAPDEVPWGELAFESTGEFLHRWVDELGR